MLTNSIKRIKLKKYKNLITDIFLYLHPPTHYFQKTRFLVQGDDSQTSKGKKKRKGSSKKNSSNCSNSNPASNTSSLLRSKCPKNEKTPAFIDANTDSTLL